MALALLAVVCVGQRDGRKEVRVSGGPWQLPPVVFKTKSNTVDLGVVVRHPDGSVISGLRQSNFQIIDEGRLQAATAFTTNNAPPPSARASASAAAPQAPRFIALVFDDVTTGRADLANARNAAGRFVREALGPGDRSAVFSFSGSVKLAFSSDRARLSDAIARIAPHPWSAMTSQDCPRVTPYEAYLVVVQHDPMAREAVFAKELSCNTDPLGAREFMDAVHRKSGLFSAGDAQGDALSQAIWQQARGIAQDNLAVVHEAVTDLSRQPGTRILVLASGGFLSETPGAQQDGIIQDALRHDVVINAVDASGLYTDDQWRADQLPEASGLLPLITFFEETTKLPRKQAEDAAAVNLAQSTGGLFFHNNNDLTLGFERVGLQPEISYQMAFQPPELAHDGGFHKIDVRLSPPIHGAIVQTRRGYFAPAPEAGATLEDTMTGVMRDTASVANLPAQVTTAQGSGRVTIQVEVRGAGLSFVHNQGRYAERLEMLAALFDERGTFIAGERGMMDMDLTPATWRRFVAEGVKPGLSVEAPPGAYTLRVVVGEANGAKITSCSRRVAIP